MDKCGSHESEVALPGLRIQFLPPRSTAKYQPLDLGLIRNTKVRYRSNLLRSTINVILRRQSGARCFPSSMQPGIYDVRDGFLPNIGDAMEIFDESWRARSPSAVMKC